ncbi:serine/threonine protein kinase [Trichophyton rubrum MR1459]|uniref:Serine/threonine protein kinase n=2 Tax=Trichophyton rubrum TaxID=5551 RepID=F2SGI7_TRIRC|nr:serine/threonine protein kinase [Trichophyton rubrum CBS 118892]EZF38878.1 serine/threonine protein kinase [Trichophyton rubrum CBS 100081]EZF60220.1 serine/threonine protein kinase [Trichophyton rubrum CBS 289.86]EZF92101.1 serine/threonine protein kinase [Trichophyton rubrum MR1459]EZG03333.1 serine/threonine protein kinase [Trichophyton rubrum CBS 735.88]KMQ48566.1 Serine/threonine/dual specificity protein kinase, catalytic domain [Trichophyton rubrum]
MASTLVGSSGREYVRDKLLKHNPLRPDLSVYLAKSGDQNFVMKKMSDMVFDLALDYKNDFPDSRRLRIHVDENDEEKVVIYEYFDDNLLSFVNKNPNLNLARKWILRELGESLKEFHAKNWIHIDVKPDNVMINYSQDKSGQPVPEKVVLGDLDVSLKMKGDKLLRLPEGIKLGNVMWRSPEAQTGQGIRKPSDVFSYGLVSRFTTTGVESLRPDFKQLEIDGVEPELEIMGLLMAFFGPVPSELVTLVQHEEWGRVMTVLSEATMDGGPVGPGRFTTWDEKEYPNLDSEAKRTLLRLTDLAPSKRATMEEILEDPWFTS